MTDRNLETQLPHVCHHANHGPCFAAPEDLLPERIGLAEQIVRECRADQDHAACVREIVRCRERPTTLQRDVERAKGVAAHVVVKRGQVLFAVRDGGETDEAAGSAAMLRAWARELVPTANYYAATADCQRFLVAVRAPDP